jgi:hypothetical protein
VSLKLQQECAWQDWLLDEIASLPFDERGVIVMGVLNHNSSMASLLALRDLPVHVRFRLANTLRDAADNLERVGV